MSHALVLIFLRGGADGLALVPPYADPKNAQSEYKNGMLGIKFGRRPVPGVQQIAVQ